MRLARTTYRVTLALLAFLLLALSASVTYGVGYAPPTDLHCPAHNDEAYIKIESASGSFDINGVIFEWSGDPGILTVTNTNRMALAFYGVCIKGGPGNSGTIGANEYLQPLSGVQFFWKTEISYIVFYGVNLSYPPPPNGCRDQCTPKPTDTPLATPSPEPSENESSTQMPAPSEAPPTTLLPNTATSAYSNQAALISFGLLLIAAGLYAFGTRFRKP